MNYVHVDNMASARGNMQKSLLLAQRLADNPRQTAQLNSNERVETAMLKGVET